MVMGATHFVVLREQREKMSRFVRMYVTVDVCGCMCCEYVCMYVCICLYMCGCVWMCVDVLWIYVCVVDVLWMCCGCVVDAWCMCCTHLCNLT